MYEAVLRERPPMPELHGGTTATDRGRARPDGDDIGRAPGDAGPVRSVQGSRNGLHCGLCTGGVRLYRGVLYVRPITDWKHTDAPPGTQPHRPVLGTPVDAETLDRIHRAPKEADQPRKEKPPQATVVRTSPATADMLLESQSISAVLKLVDVEGWRVVAKLYRELTDGTEYLILKLRRRDLGAVALWTRGKNDAWQFDSGWALTRNGARQVQSTSLKEWLKTRDEECPDCGLSSVVHDEGECP